MGISCKYLYAVSFAGPDQKGVLVEGDTTITRYSRIKTDEEYDCLRKLLCTHYKLKSLVIRSITLLNEGHLSPFEKVNQSLKGKGNGKEKRI